MADIGKELVAWLESKASITAIVGDRIMPDHLAQSVGTQTCIGYVVADTDPEHDIENGDANWATSRVELSFYGGTRAAVNNLARIVRKTEGLQGLVGAMGAATVGKSTCEDSGTYENEAPNDGSDTWRYVVDQDYRISYEDT